MSASDLKGEEGRKKEEGVEAFEAILNAVHS